MSDLKFKGEALCDIISIAIRQELRDEYKLDLGEMYLFLDYTSLLKERIRVLEDVREAAEDVIRFYADPEQWTIQAPEGNHGDWGNKARAYIKAHEGKEQSE